MRGEHRAADGPVPKAAKDAGTRGQTRPRREHVVDQQNGDGRVPATASSNDRLDPPCRGDRDLIPDLPADTTVRADLRRPPASTEPRPPGRPECRRHLDRKESRVVDASVPATPPVTRNRDDHRRHASAAMRLQKHGAGSNLKAKPSSQPPPRIPIGPVLGGGQRLHHRRRLRDQDREFIEPHRQLRSRTTGLVHGDAARVTPPIDPRRRASEPGVTHRRQCRQKATCPPPRTASADLRTRPARPVLDHVDRSQTPNISADTVRSRSHRTVDHGESSR